MDLDKGMKEAMDMDAPDGQVFPPMSTDTEGEKEPMLSDLHVQAPVEGGAVVAGKMKLPAGLKKWRLPYWFVAGSVVYLTNYSIHTGPKYKLIPPEVAAMVVFLCAICSIFGTMLSR